MPFLRIVTALLISSSLTACAQDRPARAALDAGSAEKGFSAQHESARHEVGSGAEAQPHPAMLRYPDVSSTHIVFAYADDLWLVPREGGLAVPLASPPGQEIFPKFSPDERTIAFVGNYEGDEDLYTIPVEGGVPIRVTHHPASESLCDWAPDGRLLFSSSGFAGLRRQDQLMTVPPNGGLLLIFA